MYLVCMPNLKNGCLVKRFANDLERQGQSGSGKPTRNGQRRLAGQIERTCGRDNCGQQFCLATVNDDRKRIMRELVRNASVKESN